jgi:hypothetical protein
MKRPHAKTSWSLPGRGDVLGEAETGTGDGADLTGEDDEVGPVRTAEGQDASHALVASRQTMRSTPARGMLLGMST